MTPHPETVPRRALRDELAYALLVGDDDTVAVILATVEAGARVGEDLAHCDRHQITYHCDDGCRLCVAPERGTA